MISILILARNEESNLPDCLASVKWSDDIVVLDSFSTDNTVRIAEAAGARVFQRRFDDFAGQRNYALAQIPFKYHWVFHLDADERITPALRTECENLALRDEKSAYLAPSKMIFFGKWLKHAGTYPVYQMRYHKIGEVSFENYGHGQREKSPSRGMGTLVEPYEHHSFGKGLEEWLARHNRYSTLEAVETLQQLENGWPPIWSFFCGDRLLRRRALKTLSLRLPCRAAIKFTYMYLFRGGFLDGIPGLYYCLLQAVYEQFIVLKVKELLRRRAGLPI